MSESNDARVSGQLSVSPEQLEAILTALAAGHQRFEGPVIVPLPDGLRTAEGQRAWLLNGLLSLSADVDGLAAIRAAELATDGELGPDGVQLGLMAVAARGLALAGLLAAFSS